MGKFDGKQITGLVGGLVFKKGQDKNVTIIQTKAVNIKQTAATKEASSVFGNASSLAMTIRGDLRALTQSNYDGGMVNRFTKLTREILDHCYNKETKIYTFKPDSFDRLKGFEFNIKSPLASSLWLNPVVSLHGNKLQLDLPEIIISENLKFPSSANTCEIKVVFSQIALNQSLHSPNIYQSVYIDKKQEVIPAQKFTFEVLDGCLCTIGICLNFSKKQKNLLTPMNNKLFNPAAICGAIITPGTFSLPTEIDPLTGKRPPHWHFLEKLKF